MLTSLSPEGIAGASGRIGVVNRSALPAIQRQDDGSVAVLALVVVVAPLVVVVVVRVVVMPRRTRAHVDMVAVTKSASGARLDPHWLGGLADGSDSGRRYP
jgi:flagellar biosynthesis/type III secretory pathway M-ring protein FliF/YscJ